MLSSRAMLEVRVIRDDEVEAFRDCVMTTFGDDPEIDPNGAARTRALVAPGRAWAAFDRGTIVATAGTAAFTVGVPGGALAMAGLTAAAVRPTHRRRGLLRELIRLHLADARAHGEPLSGLWASEATIYGRFGYGVAAELDALRIDTRGLVVAPVGEPDRCAWVDAAAALARLPAIYARATAERPGAQRRSDVWWRERRFLEAPFMRDGASLRRHVIVERDGADVGYIAYRQRSQERDDVHSGVVEIIELIAVDPRAEATLWQFVAGVDLFTTATWAHAPVDCVLPWLASDARRVVRRRSDGLWLRVDDVAATLAARRYAADGALRLAVGDATWALSVEAGRGECVRSDDTPELRVELASLGSLVLGGISPALLARAGRITGSAEAVARAGRLFTWPIAPWCPEVF